MNYKVIDKETYYRKGVFCHFTEDCACSTSMTARIDVMGCDGELAGQFVVIGTVLSVLTLFFWILFMGMVGIL